MVALKDFIEIMKESRVHVNAPRDIIIFSILTRNLRIYISGNSYSSVEDAYKDFKNPKVTSWEYNCKLDGKEYLVIWCEAGE